MDNRKQTAQTKKAEAAKEQSLEKLRQEHPFETDASYRTGTAAAAKKAAPTVRTRTAAEAIINS